jgi:RNA polymerase sigma-70 factor (ECF subfamily)
LPRAKETAVISRIPGPPGAQDAWLAALYQEHHGRVMGAAYRVTGSAADAEDVLQTVFVRLAGHRRGDHGDGSGVPGAAYLRRAAVNAAIDVLRSRSRQALTDLADREEAIDAQPGPEAGSRLLELKRELRRALAEESPRAAEMFALRCFEGFEYKEIADLLGTSRAVVAVTLHRVRARLKKKLGERP